jgi:protein SCO1/2
VVRDVNPEYGQVLIEHGDIPGLMEAMTMSFDVPDAALFGRLERGQAIEFVVEFDGSSYRVVEAREIGRAEPGEGAGLQGLPPLREPAPGFELVDQSGASVSLTDLRGQTLLLDFVFTHCSGPCPLLTSRHVAVQRRLPAGLRDRVRFVSVSLDPERDTPAALRAYAEARGVDLDGWSLLTGPPEAVRKLLESFGVGGTRGPDGEIEHVLATFVIDAEGRVAARFVGLEHEPDELLEELRRVASG